MKERGFLLGADSISREAKDGVKALDFAKISVCTPNSEGGLTCSEYIYGRAADAKGVNALVRQNGGRPVFAEFTFGTRKDFKTGSNIVTLEGFTVVKE